MNGISNSFQKIQRKKMVSFEEFHFSCWGQKIIIVNLTIEREGSEKLAIILLLIIIWIIVKLFSINATKFFL